jgi:Protein of unknown function (DUF3311)
MSIPSRTVRKGRLAWVAAAILLLAAVIASFWVPIYARSTPKLGSLPFFYWYQLILVPVIAIVSWIAYLLVKSPGRAPAADSSSPRPSRPSAPADDTDLGSGPEAAL